MNPHEPDNSKWAPRTRERSTFRLLGDAYVAKQDASDQPQEDANDNVEKSDPPILVRDGRADYKAKEWAEGQRRQSTHARERNAPKQRVSRTLAALARKAKRDKKHRFRSLYRLIDLQMLYESFSSLKN